MGNEKEMKWQPIPTLKSEQIDDLFKSLYGVDRKTSIVEKTSLPTLFVEKEM